MVPPADSPRSSDQKAAERSELRPLLKQIRREIRKALTLPAMLDVLARAPRVIFGVDAGAAFLLPDPHGRPGFVRCAGSAHVEDAAELAHEPLVKALVSTARPIIRWRLSENPQLKPFQDSCERLFDKMHAAILLPLMHDTRVIGGLAIGELPSGGHYGRDALKALAKLGRETGTAAQLIEHQC